MARDPRPTNPQAPDTEVTDPAAVPAPAVTEAAEASVPAPPTEDAAAADGGSAAAPVPAEPREVAGGDTVKQTALDAAEESWRRNNPAAAQE